MDRRMLELQAKPSKVEADKLRTSSFLRNDQLGRIAVYTSFFFGNYNMMTNRASPVRFRTIIKKKPPIERYNLSVMLLGFTCIVGFIAVIGIARALRARSVLNENRTMRDYIRRITSDLNRDF